MQWALYYILYRKNFLSFDCGVYLATRLCRSRPVGKKKKMLVHLTVVWQGKSNIVLLWQMRHLKWKWRMWYIYNSALCVALNKYVLAVNSCGMDHRLQGVMLLAVCKSGKTSADSTEWGSSTYNLKNERKRLCYDSRMRLSFTVCV